MSDRRAGGRGRGGRRRARGRRPSRSPGGDINRALRVGLADGRRLFVKYRRDAPAGHVPRRGRRAAAGWPRPARCARPGCVAVGDGRRARASSRSSGSTAGARGPGTTRRLGRGLAALHRAGAPSFGLAEDNFIGSLPQPNAPARDAGPSSTGRGASSRSPRRAVDAGALPAPRPGAGRAAPRAAARALRPGRAARPPARRPLGRQRARRRGRRARARRSRRLRGPPRDRPGDDAPVRRLLGRRLRRLRGGSPARPGARGPRRALPALPACWCTSACSAAGTPARPSGSFRATRAEGSARPARRTCFPAGPRPPRPAGRTPPAPTAPRASRA